MENKLTVHQAAAELGYHPNHVRRLLRAGRLQGERFARVWVIPIEAVEELKAQQGPDGRLPGPAPSEEE